MTELEEGKTSLQLPEELAHQLPEEIAPQILVPFEEGFIDYYYKNGWEIVHFTETKGKMICLFHENKDSIEMNILGERNNVETRRVIKISRDSFGKLQRSLIGILTIDRNHNTTLFSAQTPNAEQP